MADALTDAAGQIAPTTPGQQEGALTLGTGLTAFGQLIRGMGFNSYGASVAAAAQYSAAQMRMNASDAAGSGQRQAADIARQSAFIASRAQAMAAGGGGSGSDPTVAAIIGRVQAQSAYEQANAIYGGAARARQLGIAAAGEQWSGANEQLTGKKAAISGELAPAATIFKGATSLYEKFGRGGPNLASDSAYAGNNWLAS